MCVSSINAVYYSSIIPFLKPLALDIFQDKDLKKIFRRVIWYIPYMMQMSQIQIHEYLCSKTYEHSQ